MDRKSDPLAETSQDEQRYWSRMDATAFLSIPPPLRPSQEDLAAFAHLAGDWRGSDAPDLLVMGCTPDFWTLPLPAGTRRTAVDRSLDMLQHLWPGGLANGARTDWSSLPLTDASQDLALCDGGFTLLGFPDQHRQVARETARVLRPGGRLIVRLHPQAEPAEQTEDIMGRFLAGQVSNSSELKLRLAAALCKDPRRGVMLDQVWQAFEQAVRGVPDLVGASGWPAEDIERLRAYSGRQDHYTFPTLAEQMAVFEGLFVPIETMHPAGSPGFVSPIVALHRV